MSHNRIVEIERKGSEFHWEAQTADNLHEIFTRCTLTFDELRAAWEEWRPCKQQQQQQEEYQQQSVVVCGKEIMNWHPGMFLPGSEEKRIYATYFPAVIRLQESASESPDNNNNNRRTTTVFLGYNSNRVLNAPREWLRLPSLDFLPPHVRDVLAETAGLLLVNGDTHELPKQLQQPYVNAASLVVADRVSAAGLEAGATVTSDHDAQLKILQLPPADIAPSSTVLNYSSSIQSDSSELYYPEQSIMVVCNPLTKEMKVMPRHMKFDMKRKTARMVLVKSRFGSLNKKFMSRTPLAALNKFTSAAAAEDVVAREQKCPSQCPLAVQPMTRLPYRLYILGSHTEKKATPPSFHESLWRHLIVILTYDSIVDAWISAMTFKDARLPIHGRTDLAIVGGGLFLGGQVISGKTVRNPGGTVEDIWVNKIFWVQISLGKWFTIPFNIPSREKRGHDEGSEKPSVCCQAPRVLQCRDEGTVYVVTRHIQNPSTMEIWELELLNKEPTGCIKFVTTMPPQLFYTLFHEMVSNKVYDCVAGFNYIAFMSTCNLQALAVYDTVVNEWFLTVCPTTAEKKPKAPGRTCFTMPRCHWTPNFSAKP